MTRITGSEPKEWHAVGDDGIHHRLRDPRSYRGYPRRRWTAEERAYVEHLEAHEQGVLSLDPLDTDSELVRMCLSHIASEEARLAKMRPLVLALRRELANGVPAEVSETVRMLETFLPALTQGGVPAGGNRGV